MPRILIVEDDLTFATMMQTWLKKKGFDTEKASRVSPAMRLLEGGGGFDLVLSDLRLPDKDGLQLLSWMRSAGLDTPFIMMTSYAEVQNAVLAMKSGATDYIAKPFPPDILLQKINDALKGSCNVIQRKTPSQKAASAATRHDPETAEQPAPQYIEGTSEASRQLYEYVSVVAPTPMSVLILGASGTGKEYVARRIHEQSPRSGRPFVALDCGAVPRDVAASEFFGHKKGAFTGADRDKQGAFEAANGGTLFLDEMGNLPYDIQVQLLRALQERRVRPIGSTDEVAVDIRLVCATNENLAQRVAEGKFREDLYHRINEFTIFMPALRERGNDLFLFADLFMQQANRELGRSVAGFDSRASELLAGYGWPGNLRELNNVVKRAVLLTRGEFIGTDELSRALQPEPHAEQLALRDSATERQRITQALNAANGNKAKAARLLGIDRKTLYNKLKLYSIN